MKLQLFQQILELNQSFDHFIANLTSLESVRFFQRDVIRHAHSDVEIAWAYANRDSEQRRKRKGLPPRVIILPVWDMPDEDRYDEEHVNRRMRSAPKRHRTTRTSSNESRPRTKVFPSLRMPKKGVRRP